jgi:tripartite-type tricarboxylate transporter receptor subunit TctC
VTRLHAETTKALASAELRAKLSNLGVNAIGSSPDELATLIKSEVPRWAKIVRDLSIKVE